MTNKHQEENELVEIWKYMKALITNKWHIWTIRILFWQLKAKMDDQKKQIIGFAKDNALLHQRLKKCQELNQPKTITNKEFKKKLEQFER